jgi:hypothetical protein
LATAANIIERAMRLLGELASGATPSSDEYADGLTAVNAMLGSWNNERLMCYAIRDETVTMVSAQDSYTIGPAGDLVTTRPVEIADAYVVVSSISYPVRIMNESEYASIPDKTAAAAYPDHLYYEPDMSAGTIFVYPVPNAASALHILTRTPLTAFAATSDTVTLPPGWEEALATNLAVKWAPEFETVASQDVKDMARESKANIKRVNSRPLKAYTELPALVGGHRSNILTDQP